jgi:effector-binding domain-containing protein
MRILKKIMIALVVLVAIWSILTIVMPAHRLVQRSLFIKAPSSVVFSQINNLHNWKKWSYWDTKDSSMISTYEGPEQGVGAKHIWKSKEMGNGSLLITESEPNSLVATALEFEDMGVSMGGWKLKDSAGGTWVTTYMDIDLDWKTRIMGVMFDSWLGPDFEKSLEGLRKLSENAPTETSAGYKIEETTTPAQTIASTRMISSEKTVTPDIGESFKKITDHMQASKLNFAGPVFTFFHSFSPEKIDMECAVPVNKMAKSSNDVTVKEMPASKAAVVDFYGWYANSHRAHAALNQWIKDHNKTMNGAPYEVYITDPMVEKDTTKWLTKIYYPYK